LTKDERKNFLSAHQNDLIEAVVDSRCWMQRWTRTKDEQDQANL
jgi:hypothetical protein